MTRRLRPTAAVAPNAILVGDPGRALLLAQDLLEKPKMSNHARGLWGYSGEAAGEALTIQATGMGGPSAAIVLADLVDLGVQRVVRVGTCLALDPALARGRLLVVREAIAAGGSAASFGVAGNGNCKPDPDLAAALEHELCEATAVSVVSFDHLPIAGEPTPPGAAAADMQTVAVLARAQQLKIAAAAVLVVAESAAGDALPETELEESSKLAGRGARAALSG